MTEMDKKIVKSCTQTISNRKIEESYSSFTVNKDYIK